jgi:hypothetical protein
LGTWTFKSPGASRTSERAVRRARRVREYDKFGKDEILMDLMQTSEEWTKSHFVVNDLLSELLNQIRNLGYNPSYHISYDHTECHLLVDEELLKKHPELAETYQRYLEACARRDEAVRSIQKLPKIDLGF